MPGNPEEYNLNPSLREEDTEDQVHDSGREPAAAILESRSIREDNAAADRQAAGHQPEARTGQDWNSAALNFNTDHRAAEQDQNRYPGSQPASHQNAHLTHFKAALAEIDPQRALEFDRGAGEMDYTVDAKGIADAHTAAFRSIEFPTIQERVEAAHAVAGHVMDPLRRIATQEHFRNGLMTDEELAGFHPADRELYKFITDQNPNASRESLNDANMTRMFAAIQENLDQRGGDPNASHNLTMTAIDINQTAFKSALLMSDRDPERAANEAFAAINGALDAAVDPDRHQLTYAHLHQLAETAIHDPEVDANLNRVCETAIALNFKAIDRSIIELEARDPAAAEVHRSLAAHAVGNMAAVNGVISFTAETCANLGITIMPDPIGPPDHPRVF